MQGDDDQVVPYKDVSVLQAKLLKHATLKIYPGFSHGMLTTNADVINADILAFMQFELRRIGVANSSAETYGG
jgi:non-heme chloroperoxidase